jgi:FixJ family two-component response regulator
MIEPSPVARRIGVVDDDRSVRKAMSRFLRSCGVACMTYESAEAALDDPDLLTMDCLILDIELPKMSGFELRDRLIELGVTIPHLFVTAHAESDYANWDGRIHGSPHLRKPVDEAQLIALLNKIVA